MADLSACRLIATESLRPGLEEYRFEDLDDGQHLVSARIDGETLHGNGIGRGLTPYLDPQTDEDPEVAEVPLWEFEVFGHLLRDDEPVPGEVRLVPVDKDALSQRFPTDSDLEYRFYYFGRNPFGPYELEGDESRPVEETLGLYFFHHLAACDAEGCRIFHRHSIIRGGGRLDLPVDGERELVLEVVSAHDGAPVSDAHVWILDPGELLIFDHGRFDMKAEAPSEGDYVQMKTDSEGLAEYRGVEPGPIGFRVWKEGFERVRDGRAEVATTGRSVVRVELEKERVLSEDETRVFRLELPSGQPASRAFLVQKDAGQSVCGILTDADGLARFPDRCPSAGPVVVFHPMARVQVLDRSELETTGVGHLDLAPLRPIQVRVTDEHGQPVPSLSVALRIGDLIVTPQDFLSARVQTGGLYEMKTNADGELLLRSVEPDAVDVPDVLILTGAEAEVVSLLGTQAGETVEVLVPQ